MCIDNTKHQERLSTFAPDMGKARRSNAQFERMGQSGTCILQKSRVPQFHIEGMPDI